MEYIFPPSNVGLVVAPPAALREAHYDSAGATAADVMETLSVISQHDEDESLFTSNNEAAGFLGTDWRPLIQLTLGLSDLYSWIRNQAAGKRHRQTRSGGQESEAAASGARDASVRWDDERPPTPSFADSGASTPMAASRSRGQSRPASVRPPMPPSAQHRDPNNSLPPLPRAASRSTLNSPPLLGAQQPIFVTAHPRVLTEPSDLVAKLHSDGNMYEVDNVNGDLVLFVGMVLCERYEVIKLLGAGTFGQVAMCRDHFACQHNAETSSALHRAESFLSSGSLSQRGSLRYPKVPHHHHHASLSSAAGSGQRNPNQSPASRRLMPELVAVKVIKSEAAYERQSALEVNVVREMARRFPHDPRLDLVVHSYGHGYSYGHYCLVFELLGVNLFDVLTANQYKGMDLSAVREVAQQLLMAVSLCHDCGITHSDIKPENVLLARPPVDDSTPADHSGSIRLIDFGAAFRTGHCPFTYIQSRYYRAPEVILDADLSAAIDIWSVGCVLAELFLGLPLLPGGDDFQQLELMQEMMGPFPSSIVMKGRLAPQYFTAVLTSSAPRPSLSTPLAPDSSPQLLNRTMTNPFDEWSTSSDSPLGSPMMAHVLPADDFYGRYPSLNRPEPQPKYFNYSSIPALVDNYPLSQREKDWAVDAQSRLNAQQPPGVKPSATFTQPVIDGILRFRRSFSSLLELLLRLDPSARPTASDALRHPFFQMDLPDLESFFGTG